MVDDLFQWNTNSGDHTGLPPIFSQLPLPCNALVYAPINWSHPSVYLLATPSPTTPTNDHVLCSIKAKQYPSCTTTYHVARSGGRLSVQSDNDPENTIPYLQNEPKAPLGYWDPNWGDVGSQWINALPLDAGISDAIA